MNPEMLLNFLMEHGVINEEQMIELLDQQSLNGRPMEDILDESGIIKPPKLYAMLAENLQTHLVDLSKHEFPPNILSMVPPSYARSRGVLPFAKQGDLLCVVCTNPLDSDVADTLRFTVKSQVAIYIAPSAQVSALISKYYGTDTPEIEVGPARIETGLPSDIIDVDADTDAAPIIKYVNTVLSQAIQARASDIHFEPFETEFKIRYRVDGALYEMAPPPRSLARTITARVKVMSQLNIAETRIPQDGRIQTMLGGRPVDLRVSTLPTVFGESVVLRVLDRSSVQLDLGALGIPKNIYDYLCMVIEKPNGIFIVTGPTGSGKTTTLYACLNRINTTDAKLLTAEQPVEYEIEGIQQVPINEAVGLTFAKALRAFLRQDPDRIMVGETRDLETAQIAVQASLTGHLVLTTLHTNDAPGAIARLIDMGLEPFLISAALEGVLAQRLVRRICTKCKTPYEPTDAILRQLGISPHDIGDKNFYYGTGCDHCNHTGYRGRKGIYELLDITEPIRDLILQKAPSVVIRQKAIELGMTTLRADGLRSIFAGDTTVDEVVKYT